MKLAGLVQDIHTGRPVPGALVELCNGSKVVTGFTDHQGYFRLTGLAGDQVVVRVAKRPFRTAICRCKLNDNRCNVALEIDGFADEVVTG